MQVVAYIDAMDDSKAIQFLKAHVSPTNYPSVRGPKTGPSRHRCYPPCLLYKVAYHLKCPVDLLQVSTLAFPSGVPAAAANPFGDTATQPTIKNSLGQDVSVVYEAPFHALHLDVPGPDGNIASSAYIAGPAAIPTGKSTIYILLNILGDPLLITNSGLAAQAFINGTAAVVGDESWLH